MAKDSLRRWGDRRTNPIASLPRWALIVLAVDLIGLAISGWALSDVVQHPFARPAVFVGGVIVVFAISYLYLTVVQRGELLEAIDMSEAAIIGLALVLPPSEAILCVVAGSVLSQMQPHRSWAKRAFNVGIRAAGMGALELCAALVSRHHPVGSGWPVWTVLGSTVAYTVVEAVGLAAVVSSAQGGSLREALNGPWSARLVAWIAAAAIGATAANLTVEYPYALIGLGSVLGLLWHVTNALRKERGDRVRLECVLEAASQILDAADEPAREAAVLDAARKQLLWRDIGLGFDPPTGNQVGVVLWPVGKGSRWLIVEPRHGSDAWRPEDQRIIDAIAAAAETAHHRALQQQELAHHARIDALTGLTNRREFDSRVDEALSANRSVAVLLMDLDGFKPVNDQLGHAAGDDLLRTVGERLRELAPAGSVVARVGGDEFAVLLPGAAAATASATADLIGRGIAEPAWVGETRVVVTASVGTAVFPADGADRHSLLRCADRRMYAAKTVHHEKRLDLSSLDSVSRPLDLREIIWNH